MSTKKELQNHENKIEADFNVRCEDGRWSNDWLVGSWANNELWVVEASGRQRKHAARKVADTFVSTTR